MNKLVASALLAFACLTLAGCQKSVGTKAEPVEVSGKVTHGAKPVDGVVLNLQPVETGGSQAAWPLRGGEFRGQAIPGKYTYYFSEGTSAATFAAIPEKYRLGAMDRQVVVQPGMALEIKFD